MSQPAGAGDGGLLLEAIRQRTPLLQVSYDASLVRDMRSVIRFWNQGAAEMYGWSQEEAAGQVSHTLLRTIFPTSRDDVDEILAREGRWSGELIHTCKDGTQIVVDSRQVLVRSESGQAIGMLEINRDISERKRTEATLQESEEHFRLLVEGVYDYATLMLDPDGRVVRWNAGAERLKGYRAEEIIGRHFSCFYPPEDRERGEPERLLKAAAAQGYVRAEGWRVRQDGSRFRAAVTIAAWRDGAGLLRGFVKVTRDITEDRQAEAALRASEARLAGIIGSAKDAIITIDEEQQITVFNATAEEMFGYPAAEMLGQRLDRLIPGRYRPQHQAHVRAFGRTGVTSRSMWSLGSLAALRANGEEFPIEATISQVVVGEQRFYTVIVRDITERRQAEAEIRRLNETLERRVVERTAQLTEANRELEAFSYSVSHDLRAPLRHLSGFAEMLDKRAASRLDETALRYLRTIRDSARHAGQLVDDLLAFSRMGRADMRCTRLSLGELVQEARRDVEPETRGRAITWRVAPLPEVQGDPSMLRLALHNLIANAVKYTRPRPEAVIEIGCHAEADETVFFIRDNGVGFNMQYVDKLFGVFQRLHSAQEFEGTGIGLANVRRIIHRHGGRTWAEGAVDGGATFFFSLPMRGDEGNGCGREANSPGGRQPERCGADAGRPG